VKKEATTKCRADAWGDSERKKKREAGRGGKIFVWITGFRSKTLKHVRENIEGRGSFGSKRTKKRLTVSESLECHAESSGKKRR